ESAKTLHELPHPQAVQAVAWSPDGKTVLTGSDDTIARFWDADTGKELGVRLAGHLSFIKSVAWSPDGNTVATGSWDKTVRLWDVRRLREGKVTLRTPP